MDCQIYSHSDTTITTVTSDCVVSSDSEPEIIIHRMKSNRKKTKKDLSSRNDLFTVCSKIWFPTEENPSRPIAGEMPKPGVVLN